MRLQRWDLGKERMLFCGLSRVSRRSCWLWTAAGRPGACQVSRQRHRDRPLPHGAPQGTPPTAHRPADSSPQGPKSLYIAQLRAPKPSDQPPNSSRVQTNPRPPPKKAPSPSNLSTCPPPPSRYFFRPLPPNSKPHLEGTPRSFFGPAVYRNSANLGRQATRLAPHPA